MGQILSRVKEITTIFYFVLVVQTSVYACINIVYFKHYYVYVLFTYTDWLGLKIFLT